MKNTILLSIALTISALASAQTQPAPASPPGAVEDDSPIFTFVEQTPEFPGGTEALMQFLAQNLHYPQKEMEANIQGTVFLSFVVNKKGEVTDIREARGVKGGPGLTEEAIRVMKTSPRWQPGKMNGKPVNVRFNLPVKFNIK